MIDVYLDVEFYMFWVFEGELCLVLFYVFVVDGVDWVCDFVLLIVYCFY